MAHRFVLDTQALVWFLEGNQRLSAEVRRVMSDPNSELTVPIIVLAEAAHIVERGRTSIPSVQHLLNAVYADPRVTVEPLTIEVFTFSLAASSISEMHDRLIVATVLELLSRGDSAVLLTRDEDIQRSGLATIVW